MLKNDAYQKATPKDRLKMLADWEQRHMIFGNDVTYYANALVFEHVAQQVKDTPLSHRHRALRGVKGSPRRRRG